MTAEATGIPHLRGVRFLDEIRLQYSPGVMRERLIHFKNRGIGKQTALADATTASIVGEVTSRLLDDPETRRILFDARQAAIFAEAGTAPPIAWRLNLPFDQMYVEPTEAIYMPQSVHQPGYDDDFLIGMIFNGKDQPRVDYRIEGESAGRLAHVVTATFFWRTTNGETFTDSTIHIDLRTGFGLTRVGNCLTAPEPSIIPGDLDPQSWIVARDHRESEGVGWWERRVFALAELAAWMIAYMTAKGVVIVEQRALDAEYGMTRQQRRAAKRELIKHIPQPWHVVTVTPTRYYEGEGEPTGRGDHGYRYDVRGHLRFGRHPRKDGTYSQTVEWVRPHQRGLKHSVYVPKTYLYDRGKAPRLEPEA